MDRKAIQQRLDYERRHLQRTGEIIQIRPNVTRLQNGSQHSVIFTSLTPGNVDDVIGEEIEHFWRLGVPFEWKLYSYDTPTDLLARLRQYGFTAGPAEAVMVFDLAMPIDWAVAAAGVRVVRIDRPSLLPDYRAVAEEVFGKNYDFTIAQLADAIAAGSSEHVGYVAYADDVPASVGRLYTHPQSQFAGCYGGGTRAAFRGKGFYRAMLAARARDAIALGAKFLLVDALPTSRPILERLGFEQLAQTWPCEWTPG